MTAIFYLGIAMTAGLLMTRLIRLIHLPNVTAYLLAGVLIGPYVLGWVTKDMTDSFTVITNVALGFIAFSIGDEFKLSSLIAIGKPAIVITVLESVMAVVLVDTITIVCGFPKPMCIVLGALAASTAPAATLLVVRQYHAHGPLTNMLLPVVAADDATGLIAYSISISIAVGMINGDPFSVTNTILKPILQIIISLLLGSGFGILVALSHRYFHSHTNRMSICIAAIFVAVSLADRWGLSSLLVCMALGAFYVNMRSDSERILQCIDDWTYPLFMLFFVISGAELDLSALPKVGVLGLIYLFTRFGGKFLGSYIGASVMKCDDVIKKNIGWALMPQAGVAIGMATMALRQLPGYGSQVQTVILSCTLIYELVGPIATKNALRRAGEIDA